MSLTKAMLEERIEALHQELRHEIARRKAQEEELQTLREENQQLSDLLKQATAQYAKLHNYVQTLRAWIIESGR